MRESISLHIIEKLLQSGVKVGYYDPFVEELKIGDNELHVTQLTSRNMKNFDCTLILTDHSSIPYELLVAHSPIVIDTRNATKEMTERKNIILL